MKIRDHLKLCGEHFRPFLLLTRPPSGRVAVLYSTKPSLLVMMIVDATFPVPFHSVLIMVPLNCVGFVFISIAETSTFHCCYKR